MRKHFDFLIFLFSSSFQSFFLWFFSIYIARTMGLNELGEFSLSLSILSPIAIISGLQLRSYCLSQEGEEAFKKAKFLRLVIPPLSFIIVSCCFGLRDASLFATLFFLSLFKWSELWSDLSYGLLQARGNVGRVNLLQLLKYSLLSGLIAVFLFFKMEVPYRNFLAVIACFSYTASMLEARFSGLLSLKMSFSDLSPIVKTTFNLSLSSLLTSLLINIPRYFLGVSSGVEELGLFSSLFYFYVIPSMIINYGSLGLLKNLNKILTRKRFALLCFVFCLMSIGFAFLLESFGQLFMLNLYKIDLVWNSGYSWLLSMTVFFGGINSILHYFLMSSQIYQIQLRSNILSCLITAASGFWLIPAYGIIGAFCSFLLGIVLLCSIYLYHSLTKMHE